MEKKNANNLSISPDGRFVSLYPGKKEPADCQEYNCARPMLHKSGFYRRYPRSLQKWDHSKAQANFMCNDRQVDTVLLIKTDSLPGIKDLPDYVKDYPQKLERNKQRIPPLRNSNCIRALLVTERNACQYLIFFATDNKDRWLMLLECINREIKNCSIASTTAHGLAALVLAGALPAQVPAGSLKMISSFNLKSQAYSHLYTINVQSLGKEKTITSGKYEIQQSILSADKKIFLSHDE